MTTPTPRFVVAVAATLLLLAACSAKPTIIVAPVAWPSASPTPSPSLTPPATLTLAFAGDVHFTGRTAQLLDDPESAVGPFVEQLRAADFAMLNLESAVTDRGTPQPKRYHFRTPASAYTALQAAGIDVVSIGNNHTLDYGQIGLLDTLDFAEAAGMPVVGAGRNTTEAYAPYFTEVKGVRIGVVAMSQVWELSNQWKPADDRPGIAMAFDEELAQAAVRQAWLKSDLVIVYLHWGTEGSSCPNSQQKRIASLLAAAGADVIVGTHAHLPQGDGFLGDVYVHYGLGNFVWYGPSRSTDTGLLTLTIQDGKVKDRTFTPGVVSGTGQPVPVTGSALRSMENRLADAVRCGGLAQQPASA